MNKKTIVAIGGSAFTGRVFSIHVSRNEIFDLHVVNRGQFPLNLKGITEHKCDRHSPRMMAHLLPDRPIDALVDFCAYSPGEVSSVLDVLKDRVRHYILFSAAAVYEQPYGSQAKKEGDPVVSKSEGDRVSDMVYNKVLLERETVSACRQFNIPYTILRPTFIYGPFNYNQRESYYVELIARGHVVPVPVDSTSRFNMVYVFDVARALEIMVGDERAFNEVFNLSAPEAITYKMLLESFEQFNGGPFMTRPVTIEDIVNENLPVPFPLTEDVLFSGQKFADRFGFTYTPFMEGMEKTFKSFYSLFIS